MIKLVWVARFQPSWDRAEARHYWRTHHAALGRKVPLMRRYLQNHFIEAVGPEGIARGELPGLDGFSFGWFDDRASFAANTESPEWKAMDRDAFTIFDMDQLWGGMSAVLDETITVSHPIPEADLFKVGWVARYRKGLDQEAAHRRWTGEHADLLNVIPGLRRHAQNHAVDPIGPQGIGTGPLLGFDGIAELWFDSRDAFERAMTTPQWHAVVADAEELFDMDSVWLRQCGVIDHAWIIE